LLGGLGILCSTIGRAAQSTLVTQEVAPGIHIRRGADEDANAANDDAIANTGFIVGRSSVAVIDPGGCLNDGQRLRARIREVTRLPIRYVLMSHVSSRPYLRCGSIRTGRAAICRPCPFCRTPWGSAASTTAAGWMLSSARASPGR